MIIDPAHDTVAQLKRWTKEMGVDRRGWYFLTGDQGELANLVRKLGNRSLRPDEHSAVLL
ncbi:MAG: SCO family protein, partial [Proteobacteria bacterium]|nr:SCO family protein [Pseudomonadota bacterium]